MNEQTHPNEREGRCRLRASRESGQTGEVAGKTTINRNQRAQVFSWVEGTTVSRRRRQQRRQIEQEEKQVVRGVQSEHTTTDRQCDLHHQDVALHPGGCNVASIRSTTTTAASTACVDAVDEISRWSCSRSRPTIGDHCILHITRHLV